MQYHRFSRDTLALHRAFRFFPLFSSLFVSFRVWLSPGYKHFKASLNNQILNNMLPVLLRSCCVIASLIRTVSKDCYHYWLRLHPIRDTQLSRLHRLGLLVLVRVMRTVYPSAADLIIMHSAKLDARPLGRDRSRKQSLLSEAKAG